VWELVSNRRHGRWEMHRVRRFARMPLWRSLGRFSRVAASPYRCQRIRFLSTVPPTLLGIVLRLHGLFGPLNARDLRFKSTASASPVARSLANARELSVQHGSILPADEAPRRVSARPTRGPIPR
jgi:hypothetical protein